MPRGGKRPGAGKKKQGITRKVSLTLTEEEWKQIDESGEPTVAATIKQLMKQVTEIKQENEQLKKQVTQIKQSKKEPLNQGTEIIPIDHQRQMEKAYAEEIWSIILDVEEDLPKDPEVIQDAKKSFYDLLFPDGSEKMELKTLPQYVCPLSNKRFGSPDKLIRSAIPRLIQVSAKTLENRKFFAELKRREKHAPPTERSTVKTEIERTHCR